LELSETFNEILECRIKKGNQCNGLVTGTTSQTERQIERQVRHAGRGETMKNYVQLKAIWQELIFTKKAVYTNPQFGGLQTVAGTSGS
jgi:hypothetical protein